MILPRTPLIDRRAVSAAIGVVLLNERFGAVAVKQIFERAEALHGDALLRQLRRVGG